jgi:phosphate transport system permease protein
MSERGWAWTAQSVAGGVVVSVVGGLLALVLAALPAWPSLSFAVEWQPTTGTFGVGGLLLGSVTTAGLAVLLAAPVGIGAALYLHELAPPAVRRVGLTLVNILASLPSVVFGVWGLMYLVPLVSSGLVATGCILALMVVPTIVLLSGRVCQAVPTERRAAAVALGATRWQVIATVVVPAARPRWWAVVGIALSRAVGETMAVALLLDALPTGPLTLASVLVTQLPDASAAPQRTALLAVAVLLLGVVAGLHGWAYQRLVQPLAEVQPHRTARPLDALMVPLLAGCLLLAVVPWFIMVGAIVGRGGVALVTAGRGWDLFTEMPTSASEPNGGLAHALTGTLLLVSGATLVAVPLAVLVAGQLWVAPHSRLSTWTQRAMVFLDGVPSVVVGVAVYVLLVGPARHFSAGAGALALAVLLLPRLVQTTHAALRAVPAHVSHASLALGASVWQTWRRVVVPAAAPEILTGIGAAVGYAVGATAALMVTAYGSHFGPQSLGARTPFWTKSIYDYARSGLPEWEQQAWAALLVLVLAVLIAQRVPYWLWGRRV